MTYAEKLKDPRWQKKRLQIMERDDFTCGNCGRQDKSLAVDHKVYRTGRDPWDYPDHFLWTVCDDCHQTLTDYRQRFRDHIGMMTTAMLEKLEWVLDGDWEEEYWELQASLDMAKTYLQQLECDINEKRDFLDGFDDWTALVPEPQRKPKPRNEKKLSAAVAEALLIFGGKINEIKTTTASIRVGPRLSNAEAIEYLQRKSMDEILAARKK